MPEEFFSPEREALLAVVDAVGDLTDGVLRVLAQVEIQSEALARIAHSVAGIREELHDLSLQDGLATSSRGAQVLPVEDLIA